MKKLFLCLLLGVLPAHAHEVEKEGNVGALIHIEPDDAPRVGDNVTWFEVNQKGGIPITLQNCTCTLSVYAGAYKAGQKALSNPRLLAEKNRLKATVNLPAAVAYTLVLSGKPRNGGTFEPFTLEFVVRPESGPAHDH